MNLWINRQGQTEGPFSLEVLQARLTSGELAPDDLACPEGGSAWQPVAEVLTNLGMMPPVPAASPRRRALLIGGAIVLVLGLVLAGVFFFSGGRSLPKTAKYVPQESVAVVTTYFSNLMGKAGVEELLNKGMLKEMDVPSSMRDKMKDLISNPEKTGLDLSEPIFFFVLPPPKDSDEPLMGATFPLKSRDDFIKSLTELVGDDADFKEVIQKLKEDGVFQPDREVVMAINDDVLLIVGGDVRYGAPAPDFSGLAKKILKGDNGLPDADKTFVTHQETMFDLGGWVNLSSALKMLPPDAMEDLGDLKKLGDFHMSGGVLFDQGEIVMEAHMFYDEKLMGNWGNGGLDSTLLDAVPGDSLMAMSQSMDLDVLKEWFAQRPGMKSELEKGLQSEFNMSLNDALDALGGDMVLAVTSFKTTRNRYGDEVPEPGLVIGATIKDKAQVDKLLAKAKAGLAQGGPVRLVIRDDAFFLCTTSEHDALADKGKVDQPLAGDKRDLLGDNDSAMFVDGKQIQKMLELFDRDAAAAMKDFGGTGLFTLTWDAEDGSQSIRARFPMPKDDENSLKQIIDAGIRATLGDD